MKRFETGQIVMTHDINETMKNGKKEQNYTFYTFVLECLFQRYLNADWGDMCKDDLEQNDWALENGERLFASYNIPKELEVIGHDKLWIITEWDRSVTTILFPEEY